MSGAPLLYTPPAVGTTNVCYGLGIAWINNTPFASLPSDQNLGVATAWQGLGWNYIGATDTGVTQTWTPSVVDISVEEQPTPVDKVVDKGTLEYTWNFSEETLVNINYSLGGAGTIAVTAAGAGQPGKQVLTLSLNFPQLAFAVLSKNQFGFARVVSVPAIMSSGTVATSYRRAANQRLYPCTVGAVCPFGDVQLIDLTSVATS